MTENLAGLLDQGESHSILARNAVLASMLYRIGYIEQMGTGIARMKNAAREAKVAEPEFEFSGFFKATFKRNVQSLDSNDGERWASDGRAIEIQDRKRAILSYVEEHDKITASGAAELLGLSKVRVRAILREMASEGAIEKVGNTRYACYVPKRPR